MSVTEILLAAQSGDLAVRMPAEQMINAARSSDLPNFLVALVQELRDASKPIQSRQMAGIVLKNSVAFDAKEHSLKQELEKIWRGLPPETREYVKAELMQALECPDAPLRSIVALAIANLARIELPAGEWPTLIQTICTAIATQVTQFMETALITLGYICEECIGNEQLTGTLAQYADQILASIFAGLDAQDTSVQQSAISALCNSIDFIGAQMQEPTRRAELFGRIMSAAQSPNADIQSKALETLVVTARLYYECLGDQMSALWNVTMAAIQGAEEAPALQGIQFWIAIAEVEAEMLSEREEGNMRYVSKVKDSLFEMVSWALQRQEPNQTEDDWNVSTAASKLLVAMAEAVGDDIVGSVMPFVDANIHSANWRQREAAVLAFGAILHGPTPGALSQAVASYIPVICGYFGDPEEIVTDTASWVMSMIASEYSRVIMDPQFLAPVLQNVLPLFEKPSQLVTRAAAIIHNMCLFFDDDEEEDTEQSNALSPFYQHIVHVLLTALDRPDLSQQTMHDVQEALNRLFAAAAPDCFDHLEQLVPQILARLRRASDVMRSTPSPEIEILQGLIVGSLNHITRRIKRRITQYLRDIVDGLVYMFSSARDGSVLAEGIMCIGALSLGAREEFVPYLPNVHTYVQAAIAAVDDYDLCITGIATIGDIAAGCEAQIQPMLPDTMSNFSKILSDSAVDEDLRGPVINCLGDIALNAGGALFAPYLDGFIDIVRRIDAESRQKQLEGNKDANVEETIGALWESILMFGTSIVQGFTDHIEIIVGHLQYLLEFAVYACTHMSDDEDVVKAGVTLFGDMANALRHGPSQYRAAARQQLCTPMILDLVNAAEQWDDENVTKAAQWSRKELQHLSTTR